MGFVFYFSFSLQVRYSMTIRIIQAKDNPILAAIIRNALAEFGANKPGTVFFDETTDHLFELFQQEGSRYYVSEENGEVLGGGGIFPTDGLPTNTCELVKMYLKPQTRGLGYGQQLINKCIESAISLGYNQIYLETMPELINAVKVYEKSGFEYLKEPLGNSGHFGCNRWMLRKI